MRLRRLLSHGRSSTAIVLLLGLSLLASACSGGGGGDTTTAEDPTTNAAEGDDSTEEVEEEGTASAPESATTEADAGDSATEASGENAELPSISLGYLQVLGASESAIRLENAARETVDQFGWEWVYCDAEGVPEQMQTCADSLIDQGVDAILTDGTTMEVIAEQLQRARDEDILFVNSGGTQSDYELYAASYNPDDGEMGRVLAEWMVDNAPEAGEILVQSVAFTAWGAVREASLDDAIEGTDWVVRDTVDNDFADVVGTAADAANNWLTQFPDAKAIWLSFDIAALGVGPIIADLGEEPPDRPLVLTFYANCTTQDLMRSGGVDATVEENLEWSSYVALDQLAAHFANGTPLSDERRPTYTSDDGEEIQFSTPFIVTEEDLPESCAPGEGPYPAPPDEAAAAYVDFFQEKWAAEYGV